ncbi:hypothetical protein [Streptomyces sp. EN27]|uniref:hypothetical protein n=1 Tax=Streptomyces sp. EN27 TaxID=211464 RepID=UPI000A5A2967|nr:hypothetical protein [Streptomyces sp. EN27]
MGGYGDLAGISGCGGAEEYTVPSKACDRDVNDNAVVSHTRSVVMAPCPKAGRNYILDLGLPNTEGDHSDDIERFVRSYLPTGLAAMGC